MYIINLILNLSIFSISIGSLYYDVRQKFLLKEQSQMRQSQQSQQEEETFNIIRGCMTSIYNVNQKTNSICLQLKKKSRYFLKKTIDHAKFQEEKKAIRINQQQQKIDFRGVKQQLKNFSRKASSIVSQIFNKPNFELQIIKNRHRSVYLQKKCQNALAIKAAFLKQTEKIIQEKEKRHQSLQQKQHNPLVEKLIRTCQKFYKQKQNPCVQKNKTENIKKRIVSVRKQHLRWLP